MRKKNGKRTRSKKNVREDQKASSHSSVPSSLWIESACWLSDDILLVVGEGHWQDDSGLRLVGEDWSTHLNSRRITFVRARTGEESTVATLLILRPASNTGNVILDNHGVSPSLDCYLSGPALIDTPLMLVLQDVETVVCDHLVGLDPATQSMLLDFLAGAMAEVPTTNPERLSQSLFIAREAMRPRLPAAVIRLDEPEALHIDQLFAVDKESFYVRGWLRTAGAGLSRLTVVSPEGNCTELAEQLFRYPRPDVDQFFGQTSSYHQGNKLGFLSYFNLGAVSLRSDGWIFQLRTTTGAQVEAPAPTVVWDIARVREAILSDCTHERLGDEAFKVNHVLPAIERIQERHRKWAKVIGVHQYGPPPNRSDVSIIIPLFGRIDFLEQQLAQFALDPELQRADLIYVLQSPDLTEPLVHTAPSLFALYRVPFRVVLLAHNAGYSTTNNLGASLARSHLLLLLNADVLPGEPGWLGTMEAFYHATPKIGALGAKLLFEDNSIQHAGMHFSRREASSVWVNRHYFKGFPRDLVAANVARKVPAVTGACLMVSKELYQQVGGLRGTYVEGDYEDSDFCLQLIEAGYDNWYLPDAELFHLEGQSWNSMERQSISSYNSWVHTRIWGSHLQTIMMPPASTSEPGHESN